MDRQTIVREPRTSGCVGERPTTPLCEGGDSPSFILHLTNAQIDSLCRFVEFHGFWSHSLDHSVESYAYWSSDLSTVEELHVVCSCGSETTFDRSGEEVITND